MNKIDVSIELVLCFLTSIQVSVAVGSSEAENWSWKIIMIERKGVTL